MTECEDDGHVYPGGATPYGDQKLKKLVAERNGEYCKIHGADSAHPTRLIFEAAKMEDTSASRDCRNVGT